MAVGHKSLSDLLDEVALKILMIEPGDLSIVGELLDLIEKLLPGHAPADTPVVVQRMAAAFREALEKLIMGELADSAENYDLLGQCVTEMQESARKEGGDSATLCFHTAQTSINIASFFLPRHRWRRDTPKLPVYCHGIPDK